MNQKSPYRVIVILSALLLTALLCPCARRKTEKSVVIYTSVDQIYSEPILKKFEQESGIRVLPVYDTEAAKTVGLVNRLIAEKNRPQADVFWNNEFAQTLYLREKGVCAPYESPARDRIPQKYRDREGFWTAFGGRARILLINTTLISSPQRPYSIRDLLNPSIAPEKIGIANPLFGTTATHAAALYALKGDLEGREFFRKIRTRGIRVLDGNSVVRDLVASGELAYGLTDSDDALGALRKNAPVAVVLPDQDSMGTLVIPCTLALIKNSPHPLEGKALIDYLLSDDVETQLIQSGFCQLPVHSPPPEFNNLSFKHVREMNVSFDKIYSKLSRTKSELRTLFLR